MTHPCSAHTVASPCVNNCVLDEYGLCSGCHRTLEEIMAWHALSDGDRLKILERVEQRMQRSTEAPPNVNNDTIDI